MPTIVGRLCKSRQLSKKLAFLDLQIEDADSPSDSPSFTFVELVVKICPTLSSVKEAIRPLKLGDTISVVGDFEEEKEGKREHRTFKVVEPPTVVMRYAAEDGAPFQPVFVSAQKALVCQPVGNLPPAPRPPSASTTQTPAAVPGVPHAFTPTRTTSSCGPSSSSPAPFIVFPS